ncbi:MAG: YHS domain-containing protein [Lentimonas sp.]|jgi:YHS domain-containing protein
MNNLKKTFQQFLVIGLSIFSASAFAGTEELPPEVRAKEFSLSRKALALDGYDPVAYFQDGPTEGSRQLSHTFKGVVYHFVNEENQKKFIEDPLKYEPQYGGWCAWAMSDGGGRTEADPESFKIIDGKLYVFYNGLFGDTRSLWNEVSDDKKLIDQADGYWSGQVLK